MERGDFKIDLEFVGNGYDIELVDAKEMSAEFELYFGEFLKGDTGPMGPRGQKGEDAEPYDDTEIRSMIARKYEKPGLGIPKEHLNEAVRASLSKADSALQEVSLDDLTDVEIENPTTGKVLKYNGTKWVVGDVNGLPSQTGNNGKFLTTNGTTPSWKEINEAKEILTCVFKMSDAREEMGYCTCDKTVAEMRSALAAGKILEGVMRVPYEIGGETDYIDFHLDYSSDADYMGFDIYVFLGMFITSSTGMFIVLAATDPETQIDMFTYEPIYSKVASSGSYNDLSDTPTNVSDFTNDAGYATESYVNTAISNLPEPMIFKGSLGTGGTITTLPAASTSNEGFVYKVITDGTYASQAAKVGDTFISTGSAWVLIPSGDEPSGTVTSVGVSVPTGLSVSGTPVTSSGTIAISLASGYSIPTTTKQEEWDAKQSAIDSTHKLSADYIQDGTTNKVINVKPDWNAASGNAAEILNKPAIHNIPAGGNAGQILKKTSATDYDVNWANDSETLPSAYCTTSGGTAAKKANCSLYVAQTNQYLQVLIGSANTYQGALTLNINSAGAKPIYINGTASSSSNYTLPNGTYFVFYDGTNYYFRTDGKLPMKDAAFGGSYNDLANKPTIPDAVSGVDDGTNWTSITIGSNTKAIPSGGGSSTLSGLTDTSITTPAGGEVLKYNSTSSKWENSSELQADYKQMDNTAADYIKNAPLVRIYRSVTGTAAVTTSAASYTGAKYDVTDNTITSYVDGMVVCIKVPVIGNGTYGTGLQINSLGYKPIVYNVNTMITNRYSVGSVIWAVYNISQDAVFYDAGTKYTVTGCWQVMDYNADTTAPYNLTRYNGTRIVSANLYRYVLLLRKNETTLIPIHSVVGTSPAASTSTSKTMTTESFDPFGEIYCYATSAEVTTGNTVAMSALYTQKSAVDGRYIFNSNKTLTSNKEIYLVMDLQSDGKVKLASTAWSQTLPTTNDGHLYKLLGYTYSNYQFELYNYHPIYYHDGTQLRQYSGGGGGLTNYDFTELSTPTISSGATTITFAANQRNGVELSTNADLDIALISNNKSDNYIWITNSHSTDDIDVTFSSISFGATTINDVIGTDSLPTIAHGETLEIGIYVTNSKARITSRIL